MVGEERPEALEPGVDALHPPPLVGVGNFPPDPALLVHALAALAGDGTHRDMSGDDAVAAVNSAENKNNWFERLLGRDT